MPRAVSPKRTQVWTGESAVGSHRYPLHASVMEKMNVCFSQINPRGVWGIPYDGISPKVVLKVVSSFFRYAVAADSNAWTNGCLDVLRPAAVQRDHSLDCDCRDSGTLPTRMHKTESPSLDIC